MPEDACQGGPNRFDPAGLGQGCAPSGPPLPCAVRDGFADGYCDWTSTLEPICVGDADCTGPGESCQHVRLDGSKVGCCGSPPVDGGDRGVTGGRLDRGPSR